MHFDNLNTFAFTRKRPGIQAGNRPAVRIPHNSSMAIPFYVRRVHVIQSIIHTYIYIYMYIILMSSFFVTACYKIVVENKWSSYFPERMYVKYR